MWLDHRQVKELEKVVLEGDHVNKNWVGKDAGVIAKAIGISGHGHDLRLLMMEVDEQHPFVQHELLMPVIPLFRVRDAAEAIAAALRVEHGFHHTATMHSTNIDYMAAMARAVQLQHLRQERRVVRRPRARRRGLHLVHDREPDGRGPDHRRALHPRTPLYAQRGVPVRLMADRGPALGVLEVATIARGIVAADAGLKRSPAIFLHSRAVSGGKHLVMFEGGVAEVDEALEAARQIAGDLVLDRVAAVRRADPQVWPLLDAPVAPPDWTSDPTAEAVAIVETRTVLRRDRSHCGRRVQDRGRDRRATPGSRSTSPGKAYFTLTGTLRRDRSRGARSERCRRSARRRARSSIAQPSPDLRGQLFVSYRPRDRIPTPHMPRTGGSLACVLSTNAERPKQAGRSQA